MSLTSYRAALPRVRAGPWKAGGWSRAEGVVMSAGIVSERCAFLSRSGGDLLSHVLRRSTIGATALNGRVRDGIGCFARAMATRPGKKRSALRLSPQVVQGDAEEDDRVCLLPDQIKPIEPLVPVN